MRCAVLLGLFLTLPGCKDRKERPTAQEAKAAEGSPDSVQDLGDGRWRFPARNVPREKLIEAAEASGMDTGAGGGRAKRRNDETPVYVDGSPRAMLRIAEMPPWVETQWVKVGSDKEASNVARFLVADYLRAIDVPLARLTELHAYGGRGRVAIIRDDKLRENRRRFMFSFSGGDGGKARFHWIDEVEASDGIDKISKIAIYVDKKPPRWDREQSSLVNEKGEIVSGIPYAESELRGGVRVLQDGLLAFVIKRKELIETGAKPDEVIEEIPYYDLVPFAEARGAAPSKWKTVELLHKNDLVGRIEGDGIEKLRFSTPPQAKGTARAHLPGGDVVAVTAISGFTARRASATHERSLEPPPLLPK